MGIKIPERFNALLKGNANLIVTNAVAKFSHIYEWNKLEFFEDYTDHGIKHINDVLETAANIIDENSFQYLNEHDISILILAVLLHDIGMHITKDGLEKIINGEFDKFKIDYFDKNSWLNEWDDYYREIKRANDEQLLNIFGTNNYTVKEPDFSNLNNFDRRLFGEFLRRFHPRLAHEIAIGGFPTKMDTENIRIDNIDVQKEFFNLAGLVARSHGMPLRKALDYLEDTYTETRMEPYGVKVIFLMVILRIADYLQIQIDRAPKIILQTKRLSSPISKQEWEKHGAVSYINTKSSDPERIFVTANPETSKIFLELEKLFQDIQLELDVCWAALGEVYGKDNDYRNLKIKYRRIRSNLDNREAAMLKLNFVPERVFFNADPELLKLLIGPLYGQNPTYGVRELLQNAIDAIKEREYIKGIKGKVEIELFPIEGSKDAYGFIITDNGIGMNKDVLINYFFKAGASYRKSLDWKKKFVEEDEVKVQRTGRFGVGALAIFLLGDEFELWTKNSTEQGEGYYCKASLSMSQVEVLKQNCNVGTKIKIKLKEEVNKIINEKLMTVRFTNHQDLHYSNNSDEEKLDWFCWYNMDFPLIKIKIKQNLKGIFKSNSHKPKISSKPEKPSENWRSFKTYEKHTIHWTFEIDKDYEFLNRNGKIVEEDINMLSCNGFEIKNGYRIKGELYNWQLPKLSIFDNSGCLPLSLNRNYLEDDFLPFQEDLFRHIFIEVVGAFLETKFRKVGPYYIPEENKLFFKGEIDVHNYVIVSGNEFTIFHPFIFSFLKWYKWSQYWLAERDISEKKFINSTTSPYQVYLVNRDTNVFYKNILEGSNFESVIVNQWFGIGRVSSAKDYISIDVNKYLRTSKWKYLLEGNRLTKTHKENNRSIDFGSDLTVLPMHNHKDNHPKSFSIPDFSKSCVLLAFENQISSFNEINDFFGKNWLEIFGSKFTFPIDMAERKSFIEKIESLKV